MATANRLTDVLTRQVAVLQELQQVLQQEQKAIVGLDTAEMELLNSRKEELLNRQRTVADTLRQAMTETAAELRLPGSATLTEIIDAMPASAKAQVQPLQQSARQTGSSVSIVAGQNRRMLEQFLGVVNDSLGFILRILNTSNTYGVRGTYLPNHQAGAVMVSKEA
ncbi:MAG: flagellar protein FlgN [Geobacter sp.]|nr:flagellar protein FlgN [Geobacter sp.]